MFGKIKTKRLKIKSLEEEILFLKELLKRHNVFEKERRLRVILRSKNKNKIK